VITAATIKIIIPEAPNRQTFRSLLKSIKANDSFNIPTKSLNHDGNPYALNSSIISRYLTTQTKNIEPAATALSA
jgi:hypothetical protein